MILIPKVFLRLLQSFEAIFRRERQLHFSGSHRSEFQDKCLFVYLLSRGNIFCLGAVIKKISAEISNEGFHH